MAALAGAAAPRASGSEKPPLIREHKIPSAKSEPYICMEGPDGALWFCESGASKIGRFDPADSTFREFPLSGRERDADRHHHRRRRQYVVLLQEGEQDRPHHHAAATSPCSTCRRRMPARTARSSDPTAMSGSPKPTSAGSAASRRTARSPNSPKAFRRAPARSRSPSATARCGSRKPPATASAASPWTAWSPNFRSRAMTASRAR